MRFAYADPPYPGKAGYYPEKQEVDHAELVARLRADYPDGWALSTSSEALSAVWALCPEARLCVWVKAPRATRSRRALATWEALLIVGGRPLDTTVVQDLRDALIYQGRHRAFPGALVGMKPPAFCEWLFQLLGATAGDTLDDVFPGSGAVTEAWRRFTGESDAAMKDVSGEYSDDASVDRPSTRLVSTSDASLLEDPSEGTGATRRLGTLTDDMVAKPLTSEQLLDGVMRIRQEMDVS